MAENETSESATDAEPKRVRKSHSVLIAVLLAVGAAAWIMSGVVTEEAPSAPATSEKKAAAPLKVRVAAVASVDHPRRIVVTGRTNAIKDAEIKAETAGQVVARPAKKGSVVEKGAVLLELAMNDRYARLKEAETAVEVARISNDASKKLQKKQFESEIKLAQTAADLAEAEAALAAIRLDIARTKIKAPIDGFIETLLPGPGDYVEAGEMVAMVVDLDPIRVIASVTERDVGDIAVDELVTVRLPNGREVGGTVNYVSRVADDQTRSFRVDVWIDNPDGSIPAGLTAEVQLMGGTRKAHRIPSSALTLNDAGELGVRTVDDDDTVTFHAVTLLEDTPDGAWVAGLPERVRVITVGQEFVVDGQKVEPTEDVVAGAKGGDAS